ncbi:MAG: hypothetical protein IT299_07050 [Dehalococcoidia bacterium]|nr:hypothetical protein [Dehalococcoidia bacterium]
MSLILDAGAFVAVERRDPGVRATIELATATNVTIRTSAVVVTEVWRDPRGRQARLARFLRSIEVAPVDNALARAAGVLLGRSGGANAVDALVVLTANEGDTILTSDPGDIDRLVAASGRRIAILEC